MSHKRTHEYISQPNYYTCGPVALYNLAQWAKCRTVSFDHLKKICNATHDEGTDYQHFKRGLEYVCKKTTIRYWEEQGEFDTEKLQNDITKWITEGGVVLLLHHWIDSCKKWFCSGCEDCSGEHYMMLDGLSSDGKTACVNANMYSPTVTYFSRRELLDAIRDYYTPDDSTSSPHNYRYPVVWFCSRA